MIKNRYLFRNKDYYIQFEREIFQTVFKVYPDENIILRSPFRKDNNPGCFFKYDFKRGKLFFCDYGNSDIINGIRMSKMDCIDAVQIHYGLSCFQEALSFIHEKIIKNLDLNKTSLKYKKTITRKKRVKILAKYKPFDKKDRDYWKPYGITSANLKEDNKKAVEILTLLNTKKGNITTYPNSICYIIDTFGDRVKVYFPTKKGKKRFLSNCTYNDIGFLQCLDFFSNKLIVTKSYKDARVLKNLGLNVIYLMNEGVVPDWNILRPIIESYSEVYVFFDNDKAGIKASLNVTKIIKSKLNVDIKVLPLFLPERLARKGISDPSDMRKILGESELNKFITQQNLRHAE